MFFFSGTLIIMFFNHYIFIKKVNNLLNVSLRKKKQFTQILELDSSN